MNCELISQALLMGVELVILTISYTALIALTMLLTATLLPIWFIKIKSLPKPDFGHRFSCDQLGTQQACNQNAPR